MRKHVFIAENNQCSVLLRGRPIPIHIDSHLYDKITNIVFVTTHRLEIPRNIAVIINYKTKGIREKTLSSYLQKKK